MTNHPNRAKGPMFGRRHWDAMSSMLRRNHPSGLPTRLWTIIRDDTADIYEEDNDTFDRAEFIAACNPSGHRIRL